MAKMKFRTKAHVSYLQPVMVAIQKAMRERNLDIAGLAKEIGVEPSKYPALYNWVAGKNGVGPDYRPRVAKALGLTEAQLTSPQQQGMHVTEAKGRPVKQGPAARALALVEKQLPAVVAAAAVAEPVRDVFNIAGRSDGQIGVRLQVTLDAQRGMALARFLLDFGLIIGDGEIKDTD